MQPSRRRSSGQGGAGFSAITYTQDVRTGKAFHTFMGAGRDGLVAQDVEPGGHFGVYIAGPSAVTWATGVLAKVPWRKSALDFGLAERAGRSARAPSQ